jgi:hypothetical protein
VTLIALWMLIFIAGDAAYSNFHFHISQSYFENHKFEQETNEKYGNTRCSFISVE